MKKKILILFVPLFIGLGTMSGTVEAVPIAAIMEVIKAGVKKAIQAIDLKVQRLQNQTIRLQHVQKILEIKLSEERLEAIAGWSEKQRKQYEDLFGELWKVKSMISGYRRVSGIAAIQSQLVREYQEAWGVLSRSPLLGTDEKQAMAKAYLYLLEESLRNLGHLNSVLTSFRFQMNDADRLRMLHLAEGRIRDNLAALRSQNRGNFLLLHSRESNSLTHFKRNYGLD
ncbi:hypothetical protein [Algoriphagus terrigena]|uniref:hypothetical protein n=1 Tax=Algoriphagus terrigena TaxID=344884 RepID=UPI00040A7D64|nr:hypothetical protein [Algoriphagus terrigena]